MSSASSVLPQSFTENPSWEAPPSIPLSRNQPGPPQLDALEHGSIVRKRPFTSTDGQEGDPIASEPYVGFSHAHFFSNLRSQAMGKKKRIVDISTSPTASGQYNTPVLAFSSFEDESNGSPGSANNSITSTPPYILRTDMLAPDTTLSKPLGVWADHLRIVFSDSVKPILTAADGQVRRNLSAALAKCDGFNPSLFGTLSSTYMVPETLIEMFLQELWADPDFWSEGSVGATASLPVYESQAVLTRHELHNDLERLKDFANMTVYEQAVDVAVKEGIALTLGMIELYRSWNSALEVATAPPEKGWMVRGGLPLGGKEGEACFSRLIQRLRNWSEVRGLAIILLDKVFLAWVDEVGCPDADSED